MHELLTDLTAVWLGFGIFLANSARSHVSYQDSGGSGWRSRTQGYLSERALVTALAITETLAGRDPLNAGEWLKPYLRQDLRLAARWCAARDIAAEIDEVQLADYGVTPNL